MGKNRRAYIDSSAFIAFLDRSERHHLFFVRLFSQNIPLLSTSLVVAECHGWFLRRYGFEMAYKFMSFISDLSNLKIINVGREELILSAKILLKFKDQDLTIADAFGLHLLNSYSNIECWSTDRHLSLMGKALIIHR